MNPNSEHQIWSRWTWTVKIPHTRSFKDVTLNCAHFARNPKGGNFGSVSEMNVTETPTGYKVEVRSEGHPVHDPKYVDFMRKRWLAFFVMIFGLSVEVKFEAKLLSGDQQDGKPPDQWINLPHIPLTTRMGF